MTMKPDENHIPPRLLKDCKQLIPSQFIAALKPEAIELSLTPGKQYHNTTN